MSDQRIGLGVDVHPFATTGGGTGRHGTAGEAGDRGGDGGGGLVLGGARFAGERPLEGHSDADVVAHAVADAILGAAGLGDLGSHFPDTDDTWRGADSLGLLAEVARRVAAAGWRLVNADCTLVGERPKVASRRGEMIERLSQAAGGPVHVKATRPEGLGSLGRMEGLACVAVALLERNEAIARR